MHGTQALLDEATEITGLDDFGDDWFLRPLEAWAADLDDGHLTEFGQTFMRSLAVRDLARRLRVLATLRDNPRVGDVPIPPIVYVTGLERSGTTLAHNVLARHPNARPLLRWELMEPLPPPEASSYSTDPRIAKVQASVDKLRGSPLERMHWVNADEPEECVWGYIDAVSMLGQAAAMCMPRWRGALGADMSGAFANYRRVLQLLLWRNPLGPEGFLVLKAPQIGGHLADFARTFPEARFVVTDRDPYRCITSAATMIESIIDPFCMENPLTDDGRRHRQVASIMTDRLSRISSFEDAASAPLVHVPYPDLVEDPVAAVRRVYRRLGVDTGERTDDAIRAYLTMQQRGGRAAPPTTLPTSGYDHDDVLAIAAVAAYCARNGIQPERSRVTGSQTSG